MGNVCCRPSAIDFDDTVQLSHFYLLRSVGKGSFGKVRAVQHKLYSKEPCDATKDNPKALYALKYINKAACIKMKALESVIQERRILEEIDHPYVCNLRFAFQDDENVFMVLDLMTGGDLRFHLQQSVPIQHSAGHSGSHLGSGQASTSQLSLQSRNSQREARADGRTYDGLPEDWVRFWIAEMVLAIQYLHSQGIVYRDIKPDNILLDEAGHAHLTDFNIAIHHDPEKLLRSMAGSLAYMAPEVLNNGGYKAQVDWWSLGVMTSELLHGRRPFRARSNEMLAQEISEGKAISKVLEKSDKSEEAKSFVSALLQVDPAKRLGCGVGDDQDIKKHPWFSRVDWELLQSKHPSIKPPFVPNSKSFNFDATVEFEELLLEENPLRVKKRKGIEATLELSSEMRMLEESFLVYDYTKMHRRHYFDTKGVDEKSEKPVEKKKEISPSLVRKAGGPPPMRNISLTDQPLASTQESSKKTTDGDDVLIT